MLMVYLVIVLLLHAASARPDTVRVATVHYGPEFADVEANRRQLVALTEEAARNGARIVVHTEMATSGYSFFSRSDIAGVAETIPGETTEALGAVARRHDIYVVVGLPEYDADLHTYFNAAVLIGPDGKVAGTYRKRNNLLEASYNAAVFRTIPTFDTPYGRLGIVICADMFYPHFPRAAAIAGTQILLAPANVHVTTEFMRVRSFENGFAMVVANRYGSGPKSTATEFFNQETFTISPAVPYDFASTRSAIMDAGGKVLAEITDAATQIGYGDLAVGPKSPFPVVRKPSMYSLIAHDTLEPYVQSQLGLPPPGTFLAAAIDPGPGEFPIEAATRAIQDAHEKAKAGGNHLRLAVFPGSYFESLGEEMVREFELLAVHYRMDILLNAAENGVPVSLLITSDGKQYRSPRTHRRRTSTIPDSALSDEFWVVDREYGRLAISHGADMLATETTLVFAKMGVDVIAVSADDDLSLLESLWRHRSYNYVHVVVANRRGLEGVYLGGFQASPSEVVGEGTVMIEADTRHVREKKFPRFFDYSALLARCGVSNC